jgi:hypothetical protein
MERSKLRAIISQRLLLLTAAHPVAMKIVSLLCQRTRVVVLLGALLVSSQAVAAERSRGAPPPTPKKVVKDIGAFFHRVGAGVKVASKKTWGAIRERFTEDDEQEAPRRSRRPAAGAKQEDASFARSKDAVPYRYDDAETFEASSEVDPARVDEPRKDNLSSRDAAKNGPFASPGELEQAETQARPAPLPGNTPDSPKTAAGVDDTQVEFARPIPGKPGLVYPPGAAEASQNMVDVSDFLSGQIVRDPRTGKLFRVP